MAALKDLIRERRSVRTFDGNSISPVDREKLEEYIHAGISNPLNGLYSMPGPLGSALPGSAAP